MSEKKVRSKSTRKPYTAREKRALILFAAVIVVAALCLGIVPGIVERHRLHLVGTDSAGAVKGLQDNWLVANISQSGASARRYSHVADIYPLEGYAFRGTGYLTDPNVRTVYYESPGADIPEYTVTIAKENYAAMAEAFASSQEMLFTEIFGRSEVQAGAAAGRATAAFWVNGTIDNMYDADGNPIEPEYDAEGNAVYPQKYELAAYCYVESPQDSLSTLLSVTLFNAEDNDFPEPSALIELLTRAAEKIEYL